ncbi:hypothetical protein SADUNF_Sadunf06G0175100 [Salix dunnii]|uniref:Uncharacterized protein n=1 Tax=Salix dunnii TaxID=1413687 RepID=A0A835K508_9ROSI|nr:hypothetical protein SADUNF_Sadunf06G0175100 [Salix dunnii]
MPMAPRSGRCNKKEANRGAWTAEEDQKLAQVIEIHGPKRWRSVAAKAGTLKECIFIMSDMDNVANRSEEGTSKTLEDSKYSFGGDGFFDFSNEDPMNLEWMSKFLELDETLYDFP